MNYRTDLDVTLPHDRAEQVARILGDYAHRQHEHARRTRSAAVRGVCIDNAHRADNIARYITERLYRWDETKAGTA